MLRDLAVSADQFDCAALLKHWRWQVPVKATPLMIGVFGDWIFGAPDASLWHLSLLDGDFKKVANSSEEFNALKSQMDYQEEWFQSGWADIAFQNGLLPASNECLGWIVQPILGGDFSMNNIQVFPMEKYQLVCSVFFQPLFNK